MGIGRSAAYIVVPADGALKLHAQCRRRGLCRSHSSDSEEGSGWCLGDAWTIATRLARERPGCRMRLGIAQMQQGRLSKPLKNPSCRYRRSIKAMTRGEES